MRRNKDQIRVIVLLQTFCKDARLTLTVGFSTLVLLVALYLLGKHFTDDVDTCQSQVGLEIVGVTQVTHKACPLRVSLDRVVLTSTGVVLGLWQVTIRCSNCMRSPKRQEALSKRA